MGLGVGSFLSGLKGFWGWVILYPDPKGFRMGSKFGPKGFGVSSRTQNEFRCGSFHSEPKRVGGWLHGQTQ
ncbi:hypothetical protein NC651_038300 [Populus alba x Populus x berolinensis]|nr:hypothetical protein NC651_038300 [Populus alba x Populus x berolinensis]